MSRRRWLRREVALVRSSLDVIGLAWVLVVVQGLVPTGNLLAREDLAPWTCLVTCLVVLLRGGPLGRGPHPQLTERQSTRGRLGRWVALGLVPLALFAWFEFGQTLEEGRAWTAAGVTLGGAVLLVLGRGAGETAWDPPGIGSARLWGIGGLAALAFAIGLGRASAWVADAAFTSLCVAALLSLQLLAVGLAAGRPTHLRQRLAAGRQDGGAAWPVAFPMLLAAMGPGLGFFVLTFAYRVAAGHPLTFAEAYAVTFFVCSWGPILWREPTPIAVGVLLHEVVPVGGGDEAPTTAAVGFDRPPEGALRVSPLRLRRTRVVHPWIVPVRRARIGELDDPIVPLWAAPPAFPPSHALGEAAFEPDGASGTPQWEVLTIRLGAGRDTMAVTEDEAQTRRIVVLRAFPRLGGARHQRATYRWQRRHPAECLQVLDASTEVCQLIDGDVIVMSNEGVARAYEVELGAPIVADAELLSYRSPQIEDYEGVR